MLTLGVYLSAEPRKTFMATVLWTESGAVVQNVSGGLENEVIVEAARTADKVGIDCPFGWPAPFVRFVNDHVRGAVQADEREPLVWRRGLAKRQTDLFVHAETGITPLSVSADLIAHVAFRCAALLAEMKSAGLPVDRSGVEGRVVEVYPALALKRWGLTSRGYKGRAKSQALAEVFGRLIGTTPWLRFANPDDERRCRTNDDAFDSLVAALIARAQLVGLTEPLTQEQRVVGWGEGWIAIPKNRSPKELFPPGH